MNILILGRSLDQQLELFQKNHESSIEALIINLISINIKTKNNIDIYFCDVCANNDGRIYILNMEKFNMVNNTKYNIRLISKKVTIAEDFDSQEELYKKINLKNKIDIIINDMGTIYFFEFYTLIELINNFLKVNGKALLVGFEYLLKKPKSDGIPYNNNLTNSFEIFITLLGKKHPIKMNVNKETTIKEIKQYIEYKNYSKEYGSFLIFAGKKLELDKKIKDYNIPYQATLHEVIKLRGKQRDLNRFKQILNIYPQLSVTNEELGFNILGHNNNHCYNYISIQITKMKVINGYVNGKPAQMPNESKISFFYRLKNIREK
jgi:hypothetical protein